MSRPRPGTDSVNIRRPSGAKDTAWFSSGLVSSCSAAPEPSVGCTNKFGTPERPLVKARCVPSGLHAGSTFSVGSEVKRSITWRLKSHIQMSRLGPGTSSATRVPSGEIRG